MAKFWDRLFGCFHEWGEWEQYEVYLRPRRLTRKWGLAAAYDHRQRRKCKKCGKVQDEWIRTEVTDDD